MKRVEIILRVRGYTRDFSNSIFRETDIVDYINEAISRFKQVIPQLKNMVKLENSEQTPILLPEEYHHLLAIYAASRCFAQDERHYQATTLMNEYEVKLEELKGRIESGEVKIVDSTNAPVTVDNDVDYVDTTVYFGKYNNDVDLGVEGVE
jgi:hypothetical protein